MAAGTAANTVETERLVLRPWRADDLDALVPLYAVPEVWWFPFRRGLTTAETATWLDRNRAHWDEHGFGSWAAELKPDRELIGYVGLSIPTWLPEVMPAVEAGWRLHPDHWGAGLATEGGRAAVRYGFDVVGLDRVIAIVNPANTASLRVTDKLGFRGDRIVRHQAFGDEYDLVVAELMNPSAPPATTAPPPGGPPVPGP